jgi:hypothetical protein
MAKGVSLHDGVIRPGLIAELEAFRNPDRLASSYYLDVTPRSSGNGDAGRASSVAARSPRSPMRTRKRFTTRLNRSPKCIIGTTRR